MDKLNKVRIKVIAGEQLKTKINKLERYLQKRSNSPDWDSSEYFAWANEFMDSALKNIIANCYLECE